VACSQPHPVAAEAHSDTHSQATSNTPRSARPPAPVAPGAVAVDGPDAESYNDDYTVTVPLEVTPQMNPMEPVTARIVVNSEEDYELLQEQLHRQNEELDRIRRERENVAVAHVIASNDNEEAQGGNNEKEILSGEAGGSSQESNPAGKKSVGMKWILVVVLLMVIVGAVLGVVIPMTLKPTDAMPTPVSTMEPTAPAVTAVTTSTPTVTQDMLTALITSVSLDGGTALQTTLKRQIGLSSP